MSEEVLQRSKLLCYFQIEGKLEKEMEEVYRPEILPIMVYHFHYPVLYFITIFKHFRQYFPRDATHKNVRLIYNKQELPVDQPIGLFVDNFATIKVGINGLDCPEAFNLVKLNWKKGYTIVNKEGGCDHLYKKLNLQSQIELFNLHLKGHSHGLHKIAKYQGNGIAIKIYIRGVVIERREDKLKLTLRQFLQNLFGSQFINSQKFQIFTHNIRVDFKLTLKELLEDWNYNDGYCYLKIVSGD